MSKFSNFSVVISTHFLVYSSSQALRDYFISQNIKNMMYISHPLPGVNIERKDKSFMELYSDGTLKEKVIFSIKSSRLIIALFYEFFLTLYWVLFSKGQYDVYIGVDNFNACIGLLLKKLNKTKKVIYYTIDYFPQRFENNFLNNFYHFLDKICVRFSDETWNVSSQIKIARCKTKGMCGNNYNRQFTVPIGVWYENAPRKPHVSISINKIVFVGHLVKHMGVDIILEAMPIILKKIPNAQFVIIGGGEEYNSLQKLTKKLLLEKNVTFTNWVIERRKVELLLSDCTIGVAPFNTNILDDKVKNADPGKIKDYFLLGLPVVTTQAIKNYDQLEKKKCIIVSRYNKQDMAYAIISLLSDRKKLLDYRKNVLEYIKGFDYNRIFSHNLTRIFSKV